MDPRSGKVGIAVGSQPAFNAAHVADAVFLSMTIGRESSAARSPAPYDQEVVQTIIETIDTGLKTAGLSFAEYLERVRHAKDSISDVGQRWRFSARERAVQQVDSAVAQLCALIHHPQSN